MSQRKIRVKRAIYRQIGMAGIRRGRLRIKRLRVFGPFSIYFSFPLRGAGRP